MRFRYYWQAHSFIECIAALFLLYLISVYLLGIYASGSRSGRRILENSLATSLARSQMERLLARADEAWEHSRQGHFAAPFQHYAWRAVGQPLNNELLTAELTVTAPGRTEVILRTLCPRSFHLGISCDPFTNQVLYSQLGQSRLNLYNSTNNNLQTLNLAPSSKESWQPGALCGVTGSQAVWVCNTRNNEIIYTAFAENAGKTSKRAVAPAGAVMPWNCVCGDAFANLLFCTDSANGFFVLQDKAGQARLTWLNSQAWRPDAQPFSKISGLACDDQATLLWVADASGYLRVFFRGSLKPNSAFSASSSQLEPEGNEGWWGPRYQLPKGAGRVRGVAVNPWSSSVYTLDEANLYCLSFTDNSFSWNKVVLPTALAKASPQVLACDPYRNFIFINTLQGELWEFSLRTDRTFSGNFRCLQRK